MKNSKKILALVLLAMSLMSISLSALAGDVGDNQHGIVRLENTSSCVNLRNDHNRDAVIRARLGEGTIVEVIKNESGENIDGETKWYYVRVETPAGNTNASGGEYGWLHANYVFPYSTPTPGSWPPPIDAEYCSNRNYSTSYSHHVPAGSNTLCTITTKTHKSGFYGQSLVGTHSGEVIHSYSGCSGLNKLDCDLLYKFPYR